MNIQETIDSLMNNGNLFDNINDECDYNESDVYFLNDGLSDAIVICDKPLPGWDMLAEECGVGTRERMILWQIANKYNNGAVSILTSF